MPAATRDGNERRVRAMPTLQLCAVAPTPLDRIRQRRTSLRADDGDDAYALRWLRLLQQVAADSASVGDTDDEGEDVDEDDPGDEDNDDKGALGGRRGGGPKSPGPQRTHAPASPGGGVPVVIDCVVIEVDVSGEPVLGNPWRPALLKAATCAAAALSPSAATMTHRERHAAAERRRAARHMTTTSTTTSTSTATTPRRKSAPTTSRCRRWAGAIPASTVPPSRPRRCCQPVRTVATAATRRRTSLLFLPSMTAPSTRVTSWSSR